MKTGFTATDSPGEGSRRKGVFCVMLLMAACTLAPLAPATEAAELGAAVCRNEALKRAVAIIDAACSELEGCNFEALKEIERIDRVPLLAALRDVAVSPVHIFFDTNVSDVTRSIDWAGNRDILGSYNFITNIEHGTMYVIGQASRVGSFDVNVKLSRDRMQSVLLYIRDVLKVKCHRIKGGYLGSEVFQLRLSDANALGVAPPQYRGDVQVLNQAVHVFVFPCEGMR